MLAVQCVLEQIPQKGPGLPLTPPGSPPPEACQPDVCRAVLGPRLRVPSPLEPHVSLTHQPSGLTPTWAPCWSSQFLGPPTPGPVSAHCMPGPPSDLAHMSTHCQAYPMAANTEAPVKSTLAPPANSPHRHHQPSPARTAVLRPQAGHWSLSEVRTTSLTLPHASPNQQRLVLPAGGILCPHEGRGEGVPDPPQCDFAIFITRF